MERTDAPAPVRPRIRIWRELLLRNLVQPDMMRLMKQVWVGVVVAWAVCVAAAEPSSRKELWQKVEQAVQKGLPRTAITNLNQIIPAALEDRAWAEATKAIARKILLEGVIQGNKPEEKIRLLEVELERAPEQIKPLLYTLQATWYWHYFQQNRWRFMRRTATAEPPGKDFTTWDLRRLFAEIDKTFQRALEAADQLKRIPVSEFDELLEKGGLPDRYRPTLYDFIAHEALNFYTSGEQAGAKPEEAFELPASSPALDDAPGFLAWWRSFDFKQFPDSPIVKALHLYGSLMAFHEKDDDPTAFADVDLARLVYAHNVAFGEEKDARYKAALKRFADRWGDHEISAMALYHLARQVRSEGDLVEARQIALRGQRMHPNSPGGRLCRNLVAEIEAKSATINTERVWNVLEDAGSGQRDKASAKPTGRDQGEDPTLSRPTIVVRYRNLTRVYFRLVPWEWEYFLRKKHGRPRNLNGDELKTLLARKPVLTWSEELPPTEDYKQRTQVFAAPRSVKPGHYFLVASHKPDFSEEDNQLSYTPVWVSHLALITRPRANAIEGFVLDADTGEPIAGAEVAAWYLDRNGNRVAAPTLQTDLEGFFSFRPRERRGYVIRARWRGQAVATDNDLWWYERRAPKPREQTIFFTDRALYRPGQTIHFKGICLLVDTEANRYELLDGRPLTVVLADPNNKEVSRLQVRCNDYGSFSGSFTAPRDRVMGRYRLRVIDGPGGTAWFNVEEYKRPKFRVTLEAPPVAPRLNAKITVPGKAEAYTGAAIDDAMVKWRVVREVRWPVWWYWWSWRRPPVQSSQEIAHGTARTRADGTFEITFVAKPDPHVSEDSQASFTFTVYADVTDSAGETRSDSLGINVGFVALRAALSADEWLTPEQPVEIRIRTTTLDGEPQKAEGTLKVHRLKQPARVHRERWGVGAGPVDLDGDGRPEPDLSNPINWELGDVVVEKGWTTDAEGNAVLEVKLGKGVYRAVLETQDRFGKTVTAQLPIQVLDPRAPKLGIRIPHLVAAPKWSVEPGEQFMALWGTGYDKGRAFIEIEHRHKMIQRFWTEPGRTQQQIKLAVTEAMRGGFTLHVTQVRKNRAYLTSRYVDVPWSNKSLELEWEHFVSKLQPGKKETWTLKIRKATGHEKSPEVAAAELVATLYDASLDQFLPHHWPHQFGFFYRDQSSARPQFANRVTGLLVFRSGWQIDHVPLDLSYRHFPDEFTRNVWGYAWAMEGRANRYFARGVASGGVPAAAPVAEAAAAPVTMAVRKAAAADDALKLGATVEDKDLLRRQAGAGGRERPTEGPDLTQVTARKNLNETAFFYPQLTTDSNGTVRLTFTMPEALTSWRFMGFAHDRALRSGFLEATAVTSKDIMVQPNPPRFLREGDVLEFTVKVSNQSAARQQGKVRLTFADANTGKSLDKELQLLGVPASAGKASANTPTPDRLKAELQTAEISFDIPAKQSRTFAWRIHVLDGCPFLIYKAVASTGRLSDGEEGYLPVLSRRVLVTESLPLPIRVRAGQGAVTKKFEFTKLLNSGQSDSLVHQSLVVQMVSNPAWYAVLALPYLMEFPYECTEQTFNRLYANALARYIANSDPKIRRIFDQWKNTPALDSPLEKNQDLKMVMLEETPWLRQAKDESQARRNVGILFDANRLDYELDKALRKLKEAQLGDGAWPWFPGGYANDYITLYITTGFGRLRHLGVEDIDISPAVRALQRLDAWAVERYRNIQKLAHPEEYVPSSIDALYLYGRSFFLKDRPLKGDAREAAEFFLRQARRYWLKVPCRQSQGHLALAFHRWGGADNAEAAREIMRSIKERSVTDEELGMFWRDLELSWWWFRAPIETQALMIEAFDEVMGDKDAVEDCRVWLLKQKQTQDWKTTKATADAVYALLLRGTDLLSSDQLVRIKLDDLDLTPRRGGETRPAQAGSSDRGRRTAPTVEPGMGFYEVRFGREEIRPEMGRITVTKLDEGVAWGSVHWQYLEDMSKVTPHQGTPLKLEKRLYIKVNTPRGKELQPVKGPIHVGDELVVRIVLRTDRDMEYVHLKDYRGSGTEPVNVLSGYRFQDGLAYYQTTRDTASHFFIDYLPKGTYVFEYSTRVQHRGRYQTGFAAIQCMYAPEFNAHSESLPLVVE